MLAFVFFQVVRDIELKFLCPSSKKGRHIGLLLSVYRHVGRSVEHIEMKFDVQVYPDNI